jgi:hypothetical protein
MWQEAMGIRILYSSRLQAKYDEHILIQIEENFEDTNTRQYHDNDK